MAFAAQRLTQKRVIEETAANAPGFASSVNCPTRWITQAGDELRVAALGTNGIWAAIFTRRAFGHPNVAKQKSLTIAGGTMEVQNIIAKRVLCGCLTRAPAVDTLGLQTLDQPRIAVEHLTIAKSIV